ncbi:3'(2'),5'-bisphosphate nucleotidase CysQ [Prochlorococcus marinus XMU1412]|uniref:3'(2'),5'-bisphosphate nucleotidase CysQ n=1 Tax=Prochlorococcus marinus TaxID=1219 RepID=UPI001AD9E857|nr:3'(2'),5'-bisphosphate nucleotidase CysQ [Prochlorococcus marinus]MBO8240469.1 3'(2'),5'-bisphosphate nucleotidase CysQ [Prochlorococcus marinus XMU1412]MBW3071703.1 3'(2'),5'-bisphosphate nucleotidase CysQ [Prochlorococcus marinus str. MU1412]
MIKLPNGVNVNNLIDDLKNLSWEVADILLTYSDIIKKSEKKSEILKNKNINDPVTLADLEVNELIIKRINQKYPNVNWGILSEENFKIKTNYYDRNTDWLWVLDPLDGTKDFIQGTGNFAMHLALNYKRRPHIGIVLIPEKDELWISYANTIWLEKRNGSIQKQNFSETNILQKMTVVTSKNHGNEKLKNLIDNIKFKKIIVMGSIGCKVASILRGESDIYISLSLPGKSAPKDWDFAAPEAILKAAGGAITNINNEDLVYGTTTLEHPGIIIASNSEQNHKKICTQISEIIQKYDIYP